MAGEQHEAEQAQPEQLPTDRRELLGQELAALVRCFVDDADGSLEAYGFHSGDRSC